MKKIFILLAFIGFIIGSVGAGLPWDSGSGLGGGIQTVSVTTSGGITASVVNTTTSSAITVGSTATASATADTLALRDTIGAITASKFYGDGSTLTGVSGTITHAQIVAAQVATANYTADFVINSALNGYLISNAGATADIKGTFVAGLSDGFTCGFVNEVGYGGIDSYTKLMLHFNNNATDSSASAHSPTPANMTYTNTAGEFKFGYSAVFNGTTSFISYPDSADFDIGASDITITAWIKPTSSAGRTHVIYGQPNGGFAVLWFAVKDSKFDILYSNDGSSWVNVGDRAGTGNVPDNTWTYVALTIQSGILKTWINGVVDKTWNSGTSIGTLYNSSEAIGIGDLASTPDYPFEGKIDELRFDKGIIRDIAYEYSFNAEYYTGGSTVTLAPSSGERLPNTSAVDRNLKSSIFGDSLTIRKTGSNLIGTSVFPAVTNWVDTAQ